MEYFIFLKYLRRLEEFRNNSHVKIPPKSPPTNFQSLGIFKNQILFRKEFSSLSAQPDQQPAGPSGLLAQPRPFFSFPTGHSPPPPHWALACRQAQLSSRPNRPPSSSSCTGAKGTRRRRWPASRLPYGRPRHPPPEGTKWPHQSPFIPPLIGAIPPLQSPATGAFNPGPLKLLQRRPLKALDLPCFAYAL
jgi:hypothetical protein